MRESRRRESRASGTSRGSRRWNQGPQGSQGPAGSEGFLLWHYIVDTTDNTLTPDPTYPSAPISSDFVAPLPSQSTEGAGSKILFDVSKSAFRAGNVTANTWNDINRGLYSVAFGQDTTASGNYSVIGGGQNGIALSDYSIIGGDLDNVINSGSSGSIICGGSRNVLSSTQFSTIYGGNNNEINNSHTSYVGGSSNRILADSIVDGNSILGGINNTVRDSLYSSVVGGTGNLANGSISTIIGGGDQNSTSGICSTLLGGNLNNVNGSYSTISGGFQNTVIGDNSLIAGGGLNEVVGNYSSILGGTNNSINSFNPINYSLAAGNSARVNHDGTFVWSDSTGPTLSDRNDEFVVGANGGFQFYTNTARTLGVFMNNNDTAWSSICDRNAKENILNLDYIDVLERLEQLPIYQYNYKSNDPKKICRGPMAQDWHKLFPSNKDPLKIDTMDLDGISLAAIKGLTQIVKKQQQTIDELQEKIKQLDN